VAVLEHNGGGDAEPGEEEEEEAEDDWEQRTAEVCLWSPAKSIVLS